MNQFKMIKSIIHIATLLLIPLFLAGQCIGEQGQVSWLIWDNDTPIYGLEHLQYDDTYPNGPDQLRILNSTATECNYDNDYSSVVRGFISPDLTGTYLFNICLLYTSPSPRDATLSRMPSSA